MNKILVICGPTATGKTEIAVSLAKKFNGELISADSRQVYRGMDIGTGKDRDKIDVPIYLLDVVNPDEEFSVSHFVKLAYRAIGDIAGRKKLPIVVGGAGLYIKALLHPPETIDIPPDKKLREELKDVSVVQLQDMLEPVILESMNRSDRSNPRRLIRKIEIAGAKKPPGYSPKRFDYLIVGLRAPFSLLRKRISNRVEKRLRQGMEEEAATLAGKYGHDIPAMSALGYTSRVNWKQNELSYAKRQMTWFGKMSEIVWFDITAPGYARSVTRHVAAWYTHKEDEH